MATSALYFSKLYLENIKCFRGQHGLDLSDGQGRPAQWTVILGNNNMGKTTVLRALADLEPVLLRSFSDLNEENRYVPTSFLRNPSLSLMETFGPYLLEPENEWPEVSEYSFFIGCDFLRGNIRQKPDFEILKSSYNSANFPSNAFFGFSAVDFSKRKIGELEPMGLIGYGTHRIASSASLSEGSSKELLTSSADSLFNPRHRLLNVESWLLQLDYREKSENLTASNELKKVLTLLTSSVFPDVEQIAFETRGTTSPFVKVRTHSGWSRLRDLGYGYRASIAWIGDLAKRLFDRYPDSENPFHEPAVVLVDELDLHLHPEWQRKIISFLSEQFPAIQWIVTAHSPLLVQSADQINLVLLEKDGDGVSIRQPQIGSYQGWSVEEILQELMGLGERTHSDRFLKLMEQFNSGLDQNDFQASKTAYDELMQLLHPSSVHRRILTMQIESMEPIA